MAGWNASTFFARWIVCRVQGRLRGRHEPPHDGSSREESSSVDAALSCIQRCTSSDGMARPTSRQGRTSASVLRTQTQISSCCSSSVAIKQLAGPQHGMHGNGQSSRDGNGSPFEAHPFSQREPPCAQRALGRAAR